jgi:hypothetical protein
MELLMLELRMQVGFFSMLVKVGIWGPKPVQAGGGRWEPGGGHCEHRPSAGPSADPGVSD